MSNRTSSSDDRAEARRRARLAARGHEADEDRPEAADDAATAGSAASPAGGSLLTRLFPPAPPLPGKRDPLAGFTYQGPMRGAVSGLYLLATNPVPWLGLGAAWGVGRLLTTGSLIGLVASLVSFGSLILAGWLGWQRPWLYGLMAAIVGMALYAGIWAALLGGTELGDGRGAMDIFATTVYVETVSFQPLFGVIAGWYGGYLRRRMAATAPAASTRGGRARRR